MRGTKIKLLPVIALLSGLVAPLSLHAQSPSPFDGCNVVALPPQNPTVEARLVELINAHRASLRLPPLKRTSLLDDTARYHAYDMIEDGYFNTVTVDTLEMGGGMIRIAAICSSFERVNKYYKGGSAIGTSLIARDTASPEEVLNQWLAVPENRRVLENANAREIGVGYAEGNSPILAQFVQFWVADVGSRRNVSPLVINREQAQTDNPEVELYIYGRWAQVRLRNDEGEWSAWQPFKNTLRWQINATPGTRQVCAELRRGSRRETTCDTIEFVGNPG